MTASGKGPGIVERPDQWLIEFLQRFKPKEPSCQPVKMQEVVFHGGNLPGQHLRQQGGDKVMDRPVRMEPRRQRIEHQPCLPRQFHERMGVAQDILHIAALELDQQAGINARSPDSPVQTECGPGGPPPLVEGIEHQDLHQIQKLLILAAKVPTSQLRTSCLGIW